MTKTNQLKTNQIVDISPSTETVKLKIYVIRGNVLTGRKET